MLEKFDFPLPSPPSPVQEILYTLDNVLAHRKSPGVSGEAVRIWVKPHSLYPPRAMQFASLSSWGSSLALSYPLPSNSVWILQCLSHLWLKTPKEEQLCDNHQKPSPTSGAASARSTELEFHHSRAITRAKCTTTSWNCSICKGEQSINDSTAAFPEESCSTGLKEVKTKETLLVAVNKFYLSESLHKTQQPDNAAESVPSSAPIQPCQSFDPFLHSGAILAAAAVRNPNLP